MDLLKWKLCEKHLRERNGKPHARKKDYQKHTYKELCKNSTQEKGSTHMRTRI